eukprot:scaffold6157_cov120-Cyclotella_meneghiniana.AAC.2
MRVIQREFEAAIGGVLLNNVGKAVQNRNLKKAALQAKSVWLPSSSYTMHYLEREASINQDNAAVDTKHQPTVIFFHGISQPIEEFAAFIVSLDLPPHYRILVPEQCGHGKDIERARRSDDTNYVHPTNQFMLESTCEFLDVVNCGSKTCGFGISLGGAVLYYVAHARPDIIQRSVLVSPAITCCVDKELVTGILDGTNNFFCFESRQDVKLLFRDLTTGNDDTSRKKKDPLPKFFYEPIYRRSQKRAPKGHFKALLLSLISSSGLDGNDDSSGDYSKNNNLNIFTATTDIDPTAHRLVIWPRKDRIINFEQGMSFFRVRENTCNADGSSFTSESDQTQFECIPDCGHVFDVDGRIITDIIRDQVRDYLVGIDE